MKGENHSNLYARCTHWTDPVTLSLKGSKRDGIREPHGELALAGPDELEVRSLFVPVVTTGAALRI